MNNDQPSDAEGDSDLRSALGSPRSSRTPGVAADPPPAAAATPIWQARTDLTGVWQPLAVWQVVPGWHQSLAPTGGAEPPSGVPMEAAGPGAIPTEDELAQELEAPASPIDSKLDALGAIVSAGWQKDTTPMTEDAAVPTPADDRKVRRSLTARILLGSAFQVYTPVTYWLLVKVMEWLESDLYGVVIYGWSRIGKTCAIRWVLKRLSSKLDFPVPYAEISCRSRDESLGDFMSHVLDSMGHRYFQSGRVSHMRDRIAGSLIVRAQRCPIRTFILFFDEAQLLSPEHMRWLWTLSNELNRCQCRLFCLLVGQRSMLGFKEEWLKSTEEQIITRFMSEEAELTGLSSEEDLRICLDGFQKTEWPQRSGVKFPQNFVPDASWELGELARPFWAGFAAQWTAAQLPGPAEVGMTYLARAMTKVLNDAAKSGGKAFPDAEGIAQAVTSARFEIAINVRLRALVPGPKPP